MAVVVISFPIILLDEILKLISRWRLSNAAGAARRADLKKAAHLKKLN